ncbi:MAG: putative bifunctional diguanylate cyclase/phosphodiesterase [Pseudonocardia sp.]
MERLAVRWVELARVDDPAVPARVAALLRGLAVVVAADPFWAPAARALGVELFATGLCGDPLPAPDVEDVLAVGLGLLRQAGPELGAVGTRGRRRLDAALDELAAGFARGLRDVLEGHPEPAVVDLPAQRRAIPECEARAALLAALGRGLDGGEFRLVYQPLVDLADGRMCGAEALVRWQHPVEGLIGPGRFVGIAETSGLIVPLGRWVLAQACAQAVAWGRELGDGPYVSVNVSPVQLVEDGWVDDVRAVLAATGLAPGRLQLEITEQAVLEDEGAALAALTALRVVGVRLALDDFGTGYSSLSWLRRLPVHGLKIDGTFVDGLRHPTADATDLAIVRALVDLAHALGMEVTAEWVETGVQARRLAALGCDVGQGRWFGDAGPGEWVPQLWRRTLPGGGATS